MMGINASVDFQSSFLQIIHLIDAGKREGLRTVGKHIVDLASQLAPEDTGQLKDSGDYGVSEDTLTVSFGNGLSDARAVAQEFGTLYMPAQPYLMPAASEIDVVQEIADSISSKLR